MDKFAIEFLPEDDMVEEELMEESRGLCENLESPVVSNEGFYVGDICYALDEEVYDSIWGGNNYDDGVFETENGLKFAVASTAYGDGTYDSEDGKHVFPVDAGNIGIVPLELVSKEHMSDIENCGYVCDTPGEATLSCDDGYFTVYLPKEQFAINTAWDSEEDDEVDYEDDDWADDDYTGM